MEMGNSFNLKAYFFYESRELLQLIDLPLRGGDIYERMTLWESFIGTVVGVKG